MLISNEYFLVLFCLFLQPFKHWGIEFISWHFIDVTGEIFLSTFSRNHSFQNIIHTLFQTHCDWNQVITFKKKVVC